MRSERQPPMRLKRAQWKGMEVTKPAQAIVGIFCRRLCCAETGKTQALGVRSVVAFPLTFLSGNLNPPNFIENEA